MNSTFIMLLAFILLVAFGCKKSDNNFIFPLELHQTNFQYNAVHVYTVNGEVTDEGAKNRFLSNQLPFINLSGDTDWLKSMTFLNRDTATFSDLTNKFTVVNNDGQFLFTDTYKGVTGINISAVTHNVASNIYDFFYLMVVYRDALVPLPLSSGFSAIETYVRPGKGNYNNLTIPIVYFKLKTTSYASGLTSIYTGSLWNEFNSGIITQLKPTDTLAIQEGIVTLKAN